MHDKPHGVVGTMSCLDDVIPFGAENFSGVSFSNNIFNERTVIIKQPWILPNPFLQPECTLFGLDTIVSKLDTDSLNAKEISNGHPLAAWTPPHMP